MAPLHNTCVYCCQLNDNNFCEWQRSSIYEIVIRVKYILNCFLNINDCEHCQAKLRTRYDMIVSGGPLNIYFMEEE